MFESKLKEILNDSSLLINEPLANHTTMKIGGPAEYLVIPKTVNEIKEIINLANEHEVNVTVIGRGSNLLVSDQGIEGVVIKISDCLDHIEVEGTKVVVGAGYSVIRLATQLSRKGLSGLEFASGIPGSVGGGVYMNAGAHQSDFSTITSRAHILFPDGTMEWLSNEELDFSYRTSVLQHKRKGFVLEAELQLQEGSKEASTALMQKNKDYRRETQPWNYPCAGSIFRNPLPLYAGNLIERADLKGYQIGGAKVSEMHGNFIVNAGNATSKDVLDLIAYIKKTILEKFNVQLETEVEIVGKKM
ncbi:UDP-N-acetylmuramate dehydrogenase [Gottfriedia acidiceleris]|uniref:UDP-N-acetylenolpyruvoylglucosamine reductase n=1 Tax=Gottfriedia acidiceleris TaxID=371036 RepID=A0ABY4JH47_9BACI|nr:UDP-N-acetylmuramate dehydrogenase [Gottfriedia acidiceleris]UPM53142.1 UDP-N-acetylmuramate dehydrogenase [Gottfriedia acidiceleris]